MNRIIFTGTGSGYPSSNRACSSFVLAIGSELYQFDAGEGFSSSALRLKIKTNDISRIFISHLHPDHIVGLFLELQKMYLDNRKKPLDIYLPQEAVEGVSRACDLFYLFAEKFPFKYDFKPISSSLVYRKTGLSVYAYPNKHLTSNAELIKKYRKPNRMQSYCFIIKINKKRILYSGDLLTIDDLSGLMENVHTIITEGMHVELEPLLELSKRHKIKKLILTHLPDEVFSKPAKILKLANKLEFKNLAIAWEGMVIRV